MRISPAYIWVVDKDAAHPVGIAVPDENPGHGKKPEQEMDLELLICISLLRAS